ncbi:hypothetical protein [Pseudomonas mandelii]|jgi:hypothetical protein|uniref:hypothetical protein n=1 Tax=Pseudomonas mandelii TaxID=75612 RepID=UPI00130E9FE4|nr:hypothetical protein [Pseudomonas mandelii]
MASNTSWIVDSFDEFAKAALEAPAIYFAPARGAIQGVVQQWRKLRERNGPRGNTPKRA